MKTILAASVLLLCSFVAVAQTQPVSTASDNNVNRSDERAHHDFGWIGLIGLAGLAGLRRATSEDARHLSSRETFSARASSLRE